MVWGFYQAIYVAPLLTPCRASFFASSSTMCRSASVAFLFFAISLAGSIGFLAFRRNRPDFAQARRLGARRR
jgi:heme exporter protein C